LNCYNVVEEYQYEEDPINVKIPEIEGVRIVEGPDLESTIHANPFKTCKVNIGIEDNPNFMNIGDY